MELHDFPEVVLRIGTAVHRIHSAALGAWYFDAEDTWRFNPCSVEGLGACYLAERPIAGLLEIWVRLFWRVGRNRVIRR